MASPRTRRLKLDYETLTHRFADSSVIAITGTAGLPPEMYRFQFSLKGIYVTPAGEILERDTHVLEVHLSLEYPRRAPQCRMLTPVFHPNFDEASVCVGDFWAASEGLDDLVIRIGRMIAYQEYNTRSPLNGLAAKWAAEHQNLLPIDSRVVAPPLHVPAFSESQTMPPQAPSVIERPPDQDPWARTVHVPAAETVAPGYDPGDR